MKKNRAVALLVALVFYATQLSWSAKPAHAEYFNLQAHDVTSDAGNISGFDNLTITGHIAGDNTGSITGFTIDNSLINLDNTYKLSAPYVDVREYGAAAGDNSASVQAANVVAIHAAATAAGSTKGIYIPPGDFYVTSTSGNYALTINCPISGVGPNLSRIINSGTGSALKIVGVTAGARYYTRFSGFSVVGNASSEDGIVLNPSLDINTPVAYSTFDHVDSTYHGRHGLVHNYSWATKYTSCKFHYNGGLGVYLTSGASSEHNNIIFRNCDSRWNGGLASSGTNYLKGGVRISGNSQGVYWLGGVVESNNAWGFIVGEDNVLVATRGAEKVVIKDVYFENQPPATSSSTIGGAIRVSSPYSDVSVSGSTIPYGDGLDNTQTGYAFYVNDNTLFPPGFKEWNNKVWAVSSNGTGIRDYGITHTDEWGSNTEILHTQADRDFNGANHWTNVDIDSFGAVSGYLAAVTTGSQSAYLAKAGINNGMGFVYGKRYGIKYDAAAAGTIYFASSSKAVKLPNFTNGTGQTQEFTWIETGADQGFYIFSEGAATLATLDNVSIYEIGGGVAPQGLLNGLLSVTTVSFAANDNTVLYTVPTGKRAVLSHAIVVAGADAGATTTVSIGISGADNDFIPANTLSNLDAQYDSVILMPIPNTTPLKVKSYAAGAVIRAQVANQSGGATNTVYLFGLVY